MKTIFIGPRTSIQPDEVTHLQADVNYTFIFNQKSGRRIIAYTLKKVLETLEDHGAFVRISRKHAINLNFVAHSDHHSVRLKNGLELKPSRRRKRRMAQMMNEHHMNQ